MSTQVTLKVFHYSSTQPHISRTTRTHVKCMLLHIWIEPAWKFGTQRYWNSKFSFGSLQHQMQDQAAWGKGMMCYSFFYTAISTFFFAKKMLPRISKLLSFEGVGVAVEGARSGCLRGMNVGYRNLFLILYTTIPTLLFSKKNTPRISTVVSPEGVAVAVEGPWSGCLRGKNGEL